MVKLGIVLPLTGAEAKFGEIEKRSFEMAVDEINKKGGINGKKLELVIEDDTGRPDVGPWDYVFRLNPAVSEYAGAIESLLTDVAKPGTVAILHENSLFGTSGAKSFEKTCNKLDYKVLLKQGYEAGQFHFCFGKDLL